MYFILVRILTFYKCKGIKVQKMNRLSLTNCVQILSLLAEGASPRSITRIAAKPRGNQPGSSGAASAGISFAQLVSQFDSALSFQFPRMLCPHKTRGRPIATNQTGTLPAVRSRAFAPAPAVSLRKHTGRQSHAGSRDDKRGTRHGQHPARRTPHGHRQGPGCHHRRR